MATPKRRFFRYSLRTMLVVVLVLSVWLGYMANQAAKQRAAVNAIKDAGGLVFYDYQWIPQGPFGRWIPDAEPPAPEWVRRLLGIDWFATVERLDISRTRSRSRRRSRSRAGEDALPPEVFVAIGDLSELRVLLLNNCQLTDNAMAHLAGLRKLEILHLARNRIGDRGLEQLRGCTGLEVIGLSRNRIAGAGLAHLSQMAKLRWLHLGSNPIDDEGAASLARIESLEYLRLAGTKVTDAGLMHFKAHKNLRSLNVIVTDVSPAAARKLEAARPGLGILDGPREFSTSN